MCVISYKAESEYILLITGSLTPAEIVYNRGYAQLKIGTKFFLNSEQAIELTLILPKEY